ncbi:MAG: FAD-dependent oxidoreductase [Planctomycetota bacterium]
MQRIPRQPEKAAAADYDLIVVGGGVYGVFLALHAARCGLRPLLLERNDFGGGVSANSLRIVHGGLRYLQSMDLSRHRESVAERRWHLRCFPDLVRPLSCVMPLYGRGLKRPSTFRAALAMNDALSLRRNRGVREDRKLPRGRVISRGRVEEASGLIPTDGLKGGGLWHDAMMISSERVLIEALAWAVNSGAGALNYVEAMELIVEDGRAAGVIGVDHLTGARLTFKSTKVVNAAGPACRALAERWHKDRPELFRKSLAFNLLFDRPAVSEHALAVSPAEDASKAYFVVPWKGRLMAGTCHAPAEQGDEAGRPGEALIEAFIDGINASLPGLGLSRSKVRRIYAGLLPADREGGGEPSHRPEVIDHGQRGGAKGLYSISGVKWTTARRVAADALTRVMGRRLKHLAGTTPPPPHRPAELSNLGLVAHDANEMRERLGELVEAESVVHLDDLLLRRVAGLDSDEAMVAAARAGAEVMGLRVAGLDTAWDRLVAALRSQGDAAADAVDRARPSSSPANVMARHER